jgi:hypothetical protein
MLMFQFDNEKIWRRKRYTSIKVPCFLYGLHDI